MSDPIENKPSDQQEQPTGIIEHSEEWGTITIEVSADATKAHLIKISLSDGTSAITDRMFNSALNKMGIVHGISANIIEANQKALFKSSEWQGRVEIAKGTPARSSSDLNFDFISNSDNINLTSDTWKINSSSISFSSIMKLFNTPGIDGLGSSSLTVKFIKKGATIASQMAAGENTDGLTIYNGSIPAIEGSPHSAGDNVTLAENKFTAECYGILLVAENCISILPPLKISDDQMQVAYLNLMQVPPIVYPSPTDIHDILKLIEVTFGVNEKSIKHLSQTMAEGSSSRVMIIAKGIEPVQGKNAELKINRKIIPTEETVADNGSIDFHELDLFFSVTEDYLVAVKTLATEGTQGKTVLGNAIEADKGDDVKVNPKEGLRTDESEECHKYFAETAGIVKTVGDDISVVPICKINGDVNFSVGNIDIDKDLHISGSVLADFHVIAKGSAQIDGMLEPGAKLEISGDAEIKQGIIGEDTKAFINGNLSTSFIQDADVTVNGNLFVKSHIYNAKIKVNGSVIVEGTGSGKMNGSITGGSIECTENIISVICGSPSNVETNFIFQVEQAKKDTLQKLIENLQLCEENITKIMRTVQLKSISKESMTALLKSVKPKRQKLFVTILKKLNVIVKQKGQLFEEKKKLSSEIKEIKKKFSVTSKKYFFGACKITMDCYSFTTRTDIGPSNFKLVKNEIIRETPEDFENPKFEGVSLAGQNK